MHSCREWGKFLWFGVWVVTPRKQKRNSPEITWEFDEKQSNSRQWQVAAHDTFQSEAENLYQALQAADPKPYSKHAWRLKHIE